MNSTSPQRPFGSPFSETPKNTDEPGISVLREAARTLGFPLFGVTRAECSSFFPEFQRWLEAGMHAEMEYMRDRSDAFRHPAGVLPDVQSIIALGMPFTELERTVRQELPPRPVREMLSDIPSENFSPDIIPADAPNTPNTSNVSNTPDTPNASNASISPDFGLVARYAASGADYHDTIRKKLKLFQKTLKELYPAQTSRGTVDTAPIFEREFASRAGIGFIGRNRMLIHPSCGSFFFIALVLTTEKLPETVGISSETQAKMRRACDSCGRCLCACPTQALSDGGLDARRCLSALTIESRLPIPSDLRPFPGRRFFGCDVCQEVCPWNHRFLSANPSKLFPLSPLFHMTEEEFRRIFAHTPFFRPSLSGLQRNAAAVSEQNEASR